MANMDPVGYAEIVDPNKFITLSDVIRAVSPTPVNQPKRTGRPTNIIPELPVESRATLAGGIGGAPLPQLTPTAPGKAITPFNPQPEMPNSSYWANFQPMADERRPVSSLPTMETRTPAPTPTLPQPAAVTAPRGNGIVPNADVAGTYTPSAPVGTAQPISIVRGLQTTEYMPTMNERGQVQYKAKQTPEQLLAAAQAEVGLKKTLSEIEKNLRGTGMDQAIRAYMAPVASLQATIESPNSTEDQRTKAQARLDKIFQDILKVDALTRYFDPTAQNTGG